jgi:cholest-4-en-3-one 26-monooxygenase
MVREHIDLANPDAFVPGTPHHWFTELRREDPVYWHPEKNGGPGFWVVTKYDDLRHVSRNPQLYSSEVGGTTLVEPDAAERAASVIIMLNMDPPRHVKFRRIVQRGFTPRMIGEQEGHIRELARRIVAGVVDRGEADFVEEIAAELPLQVICEMMGVPYEDRKLIFELSNKLVGFDDPELQNSREDQRQASMQMFGYSMKLAEHYKKNPADNLTTLLLKGEVDGENLNEAEYSGFFLLLCVAGNETTRTVTTNGMKLLIENPDALRALVDDPKLIPSAVEEFLRYDPAVHYFRRTVLEDTELRGRKLRAGDKLTMWYPSVNRDEDVFPDAQRFDIRRSPNEHLAFGIGEHFCLGANLARLELKVIFEELLPRLRNPRLTKPVRRLRSNFVNGVKEMRIAWDPA